MECEGPCLPCQEHCYCSKKVGILAYAALIYLGSCMLYILFKDSLTVGQRRILDGSKRRRGTIFAVSLAISCAILYAARPLRSLQKRFCVHHFLHWIRQQLNEHWFQGRRLPALCRHVSWRWLCVWIMEIWVHLLSGTLSTESRCEHHQFHQFRLLYCPSVFWVCVHGAANMLRYSHLLKTVA